MFFFQEMVAQSMHKMTLYTQIKLHLAGLNKVHADMYVSRKMFAQL